MENRNRETEQIKSCMQIVSSKTGVGRRLTKEEKEVAAKELKTLAEKESKMVRGRFQNFECKGAAFGFMYRKFATDPLEKYTMEDGEVYEIPLRVAKHLNSNVFFETARHKNKEKNLTFKEKVKRVGFQSLDFEDLMN